MKIINSTQNKKLKQLCKLHTKKERDHTGLFLVEGMHMIEEAKCAHCLKEVFLLEGMEPLFEDRATVCSAPVIQKLSNQNSQAKIIGLCEKPKQDPKQEKAILILDDIQDPGNAGTLIRTAFAFGMDKIYCSEHTVDFYNPKVLQASQGAIFHIPIQRGALEEVISSHQKEGMKILGTSLHKRSMSLGDVQIQAPYGIVLGNEGQGVHPELLDLCDTLIKIEMEQFESLNVAIAGGILMYTLRSRFQDA